MTSEFIDAAPTPRLRMKFEAAIFDMDGLLIDSERPIRDAWLAAARDLDLALDEANYLCAVRVNDADSCRSIAPPWCGRAPRLC